ncbi:FGGY family carbohydrate kinase [Blautia schinkii]|nr:FGGY family carbohydrate kinase [Blautia schinkii]
MNILVIDAGTSSMRGILFSEEGKQLSVSQKFYRVTYLPQGWAEQNPDDWSMALRGILKETGRMAEAKGYSIDALALTAQRSSVIPMDGLLNPLANAVMWQDKRTEEICRRLEKENGTIFPKAGARVNPVFSGSKMTWFRENQPEIYGNTWKFLVVADYLLYLLTNEVGTDLTYGSRSLLMNLEKGEWDEELLELFRVNKEKLCPLVEPGSVFGALTEEMAELLGCRKGIPVITAGGDQQCGAIGQGVVKEGILSVTAGTGGFLIVSAKEVPQNLQQNVICNAASLKGQYILEFGILTCCSAFDWFCRSFYDGWSYEAINAEVERSPAGANGCMVLPYFQGRSTPDWNRNARGMFANISLDIRRCDMLRALLESICYEFGNGIEILERYVEVSDIYINGGLTNSEPFNEIQADVYHRKIIRMGSSDATARGALIVALNTLGIYPSEESAFTALNKGREQKVYLPDESRSGMYQQKRCSMNSWYTRTYA